jgi:5-methylcytosine-specific restriction endonuclease McrA
MPTMPPTFRPQGYLDKQGRQRQHDAKRGSARQRGYGTQWDKCVATFKLSHPLCLGCQAIGLVQATELVDHVEPHRGNQAKFWNSAMWQPSCRWHHDVVKKKLEAMFDRGQIGIDALWLNSPTAIALAKSGGRLNP